VEESQSGKSQCVIMHGQIEQTMPNMLTKLVITYYYY